MEGGWCSSDSFLYADRVHCYYIMPGHSHLRRMWIPHFSVSILSQVILSEAQFYLASRCCIGVHLYLATFNLYWFVVCEKTATIVLVFNGIWWIWSFGCHYLGLSILLMHSFRVFFAWIPGIRSLHFSTFLWVVLCGWWSFLMWLLSQDTYIL